MKHIYHAPSRIAGNGLFTAEPVAAGETIAHVTGPLRHLEVTSLEVALSNPDWIGVGPDLWIEPQGVFRFLNHSCAPSAALTGRISVGEDGKARGSYRLVALSDIAADQEISIDYSLIEGDPMWEMPCDCRASDCRALVRGITSLPPDRFAACLPFVPDYFRSLYTSCDKRASSSL